MAANTPSSNPTEGAQRNSLGELFVNIGSRGVPNLLKGLNAVQAQFLLSKTAAEQFLKPIINMSKTAGAAVTTFDKINAVTGISAQNLQNMSVWAKLNNVSFEDLISQLAKMQQNLLNIRLGQGDTTGWQLLGIDPNAFDYRQPEKAFEAIKNRVQELDEATGALALSYLGFSPDLLYAFKQQNEQFNTRLLLTDKEMKNARAQQRLWNTLGATWQQAQQKFIANQSSINSALQLCIEYLNKLANPAMIEKIDKVIGGIFKTFIGWAYGFLENIAAFQTWLEDRGLAGEEHDKEVTKKNREKAEKDIQFVSTVADPIAERIYNLTHGNKLTQTLAGAGLTDEQKNIIIRRQKELEEYNRQQINQWNPLPREQTRTNSNYPTATPIINYPTATPEINNNNSTSNTRNITNNVTVNQDIRGNNPQEIGNSSAQQIENLIRELQNQSAI